MTALINRIIDYSAVNGPGTRSVLVFQGCNFRCRYCHVPDTLGNCNGCGVCAYHCPAGALKLEAPGTAPQWIEENCIDCGACINACRKDSSPKIRRMSIKDVLDHVMEHRRYIRGITCSGGECTLYAEFMTELFPLIRRQKLSCLIETNGTLNFDGHRDLMDCCDGVMLDIKAADPGRHRELTGRDNGAVFKSAAVLARMGKLLEIRTLVTRADYGARETVKKAAAVLAPYLGKSDIAYRLIPFRVFGVRREYRGLGTPSREFMEDLQTLALACGFPKVIVS
ncbi:MAG: YjjW family glycine radical enzyme activase [Treponema sp.]|jgi:pyruvate formate lyase activating enzyme|nr:YjjW family glycine radical enzyme activase [Treponema sp.]